ncbi:MAG: RluA family pseudouridine synthase [Treponema sp.]|nr:RluA family pseudouridine synthase [Treponema sp.]
MPFFSVKVPIDFCDYVRLDKYIASLPNGMNRSKLKSGVSEILINGKREKISFKVRAGDQIDIEWEDNVPDDIIPENIPLDIIYEDKNITVINKKQGMVTHPASGNWSGTLVNALLYHWGRSSVQINKGNVSEVLAARRPGIVHRLDKDTSGVIITAKNRDSEEWLQTQFKLHKLRKEYIVIVRGIPPVNAGDIRTQIIRDPKNRKRYKAVTGIEEGKTARTLYHCIACYGNYSLLRVRLKTGRTHQIRVHMKYLGCPVLGDSIYGKKDELFPDATLMLHARELIVKLPGNKKYRIFRADIPERFKNVLKILKKKYPRIILDDIK